MSRPEDTPMDDKAPPYGGEQPPSYEDVTKQQAPRPLQPLVNFAGPSQTPQKIPRQFPPAFNLYRTSMGYGSCTLGEHQNQPVYFYGSHSGLSSAPPVILHSGPDESFPPLAAAERRSFGYSFDVNLPPLPGSGTRSHREEIAYASGGFGPGAYRFAIEVGHTGVRETFEWRYSRGDAIASLNGMPSGYKLVRLTRGPPGGGGRGDLNFVSGGFVDSEGNEVVAAWAMARGSLTKTAKFQFMGTGLTGLLGERWAIMAVITFLVIYQRVQRSRN